MSFDNFFNQYQSLFDPVFQTFSGEKANVIVLILLACALLFLIYFLVINKNIVALRRDLVEALDTQGKGVHAGAAPDNGTRLLGYSGSGAVSGAPESKQVAPETTSMSQKEAVPPKAGELSPQLLKWKAQIVERLGEEYELDVTFIAHQFMYVTNHTAMWSEMRKKRRETTAVEYSLHKILMAVVGHINDMYIRELESLSQDSETFASDAVAVVERLNLISRSVESALSNKAGGICEFRALKFTPGKFEKGKTYPVAHFQGCIYFPNIRPGIQQAKVIEGAYELNTISIVSKADDGIKVKDINKPILILE